MTFPVGAVPPREGYPRTPPPSAARTFDDQTELRKAHLGIAMKHRRDDSRACHPPFGGETFRRGRLRSADLSASRILMRTVRFHIAPLCVFMALSAPAISAAGATKTYPVATPERFSIVLPSPTQTNEWVSEERCQKISPDKAARCTQVAEAIVAAAARPMTYNEYSYWVNTTKPTSENPEFALCAQVALALGNVKADDGLASFIGPYASIVKSAYQDSLGREPTVAEHEYWRSKPTCYVGILRANVAWMRTNDRPALDRIVNGGYAASLGRQATEAEHTYWAQQWGVREARKRANATKEIDSKSELVSENLFWLASPAGQAERAAATERIWGTLFRGTPYTPGDSYKEAVDKSFRRCEFACSNGEREARPYDQVLDQMRALYEGKPAPVAGNKIVTGSPSGRSPKPIQ